MRTIITTIAAAILLTACASVPSAQKAGTTYVYDHKTNSSRAVATASANEFVGTSASQSAPKSFGPSRSATGHP